MTGILAMAASEIDTRVNIDISTARDASPVMCSCFFFFWSTSIGSRNNGSARLAAAALPLGCIAYFRA